MRYHGSCKWSVYHKGLQRTPRLCRISEQACERAMRESGCGTKENAAAVGATMYVLGPVLVSFVHWLLEQAVLEGYEKLYFLARDGWLMRFVAQELCRLRGLSVECRYLYASRYAWQVPEHHLIGKRSLERICRGGLAVTFAHMMRRAGLSRQEGLQIANLAGMGQRYDEVLSRREIRRLAGRLADLECFWQLVGKRSRKSYETAAAYLKQEGLLDGSRWAMVDSGWIGTMQESLQNLLAGAGAQMPVQGYYFGLYQLPRGAETNRYHAYYFGPENGLWEKSHFANCLFECVFTAPHGMTVGYEAREGRIDAVLAGQAEENRNFLEWQIRLFRIYLEELKQAWGRETERELGSVPVRELLSGFMSAPSLEESRFYGKILFSDGVTEEKMQPLAARRLPDSGWPEGSVRLSGGVWRKWRRAGILCYKYALYLRMQRRFRGRQKTA